MYSDRDLTEATRRLRALELRLGAALIALLAALVVGLARRIAPLAYASAALLFVAGCFGVSFYLLPNTRYRDFLLEMRAGLSAGMSGTVEAIAEDEALQDGARVLQVRVRLADEDDERIVYLNASKRDLFPPVGARVRLSLFGRHIRSVEVE